MVVRRALILAAVVIAATQPAAAAPGDFVPIDDVHPGDRCVGRSVFSGTKIDEFGIEILAVVRRGPGGDLIIGRAEGDVFDEAGIPQGMSGTPVYRDGRLIGAISTAWPWSKEPIAGITPIEEMLPALDAAAGPSKGGTALGAALIPPDERDASRIARLSALGGVSSGSPAAIWGASSGEPAGGMAAIASPLVVTGGTDAYLRSAAALLSPSGLAPVRGSSSVPAPASSEIVPGATVGVMFVGGDMTWTAIGTLTYRDGDRILAFGHPIFGAGPVELPMVGGYVHTILPLASVSFKYASGTEPVGAVLADRSRAAGGVVGPPPPMIPLSVSVTAAEGGQSFSFDVVRTAPYASVFAGLAAGAAISEASQETGAALVEIEARVETGDGPVTYREVFQTTQPSTRAAGELATLLDLVQSNAFRPEEILAASLDVRVQDGRHVASVEAVSTDRAVYRPGDEVVVRVSLADWQGGRRVETASLLIPRGTPDGRLTLRAGGAEAYYQWEADRLGAGTMPRTYAQLVRLIETSKPGDAVVVELLSPKPGLSLSGSEMKKLPGTAALVMSTASESGAVDQAAESVLASAELTAGAAVQGYHELSVFVRSGD
jgi:hypothetical protein